MKNSAKPVEMRQSTIQINYPLPKKEVTSTFGGVPLNKSKSQPSQTIQPPKPTMGIELGQASKYIGVKKPETSTKTDFVSSAKKYGIDVPASVMNHYSKPGSSQGKGREDEVSDHGLTEEQLKTHMITLPTQGLLSNTSLTNDEQFKSLLQETKSHYDIILESQEKAAMYFFKQIFMIGTIPCGIIEVEFYQSPDPYALPYPALCTAFKFWFNQRLAKINETKRVLPSGTVFCSSKTKGLYVTLGGNGSYCGMLIRSIVTPTGVIEGPGEVVDFILSTLKFESLYELHDSLTLKSKELGFDMSAETIPSNLSSLGLFLTDTHDQHPYFNSESVIYNSPRVGLSLRKEKEMYGQYSMFVMRPYRFCHMPHKLKHGKNLLALCCRLKGIPDMTIVEKLALPKGQLSNWVNQFIQGETSFVEKFYSRENAKLATLGMQCMAFGFFNRFNK
jgi:hypothetical protein